LVKKVFCLNVKSNISSKTITAMKLSEAASNTLQQLHFTHRNHL